MSPRDVGPAGLWPHLAGIAASLLLPQLLGPNLGPCNLPNLLRPQGLCAGPSGCLETPAPRCCWQDSLFPVVHSDFSSEVTQRDLWPPSLEKYHLPNWDYIAPVSLSREHFLVTDITCVLTHLALLDCDWLAAGTSVLGLFNPPRLEQCLKLLDRFVILKWLDYLLTGQTQACPIYHIIVNPFQQFLE